MHKGIRTILVHPHEPDEDPLIAFEIDAAGNAYYWSNYDGEEFLIELDNRVRLGERFLKSPQTALLLAGRELDTPKDA